MRTVAQASLVGTILAICGLAFAADPPAPTTQAAAGGAVSTQPAWGKETKGLVARVDPIKTTVASGQVMEFELSVKNVTNADLVMPTAGRPEAWELQFHPNNYAWLEWRNPTGTDATPKPVALAVPAGQTVTLLLSAGDPKMAGYKFLVHPDRKPPWPIKLDDGDYQVKAAITIFADATAKPGDWTGKIETAPVKLTVSSPPTSQPAAAPDVAVARKIALDFVKARGLNLGRITRITEHPKKDRWVVEFGEKPFPKSLGPPGVWVFKSTGQVELYPRD